MLLPSSWANSYRAKLSRQHILEHEPQSALAYASSICTRDLTEVAGGEVAHRSLELSVVESIEKLRTEFQGNSFGNGSDLMQCRIKVIGPGSGKEKAVGITRNSQRLLRKDSGIEILVPGSVARVIFGDFLAVVIRQVYRVYALTIAVAEGAIVDLLHQNGETSGKPRNTDQLPSIEHLTR